MPDPAIIDAIRRAAIEGGVSPAFALAIADRESTFNPRARSSKTIAGLYQMRGDYRNKYGVGDSADPYTQAKGWTGFIGDVKKEMAPTLGRAPTDAEAYLGHHYGGERAARTLKMDPNTPVDQIFTPKEMALNPHFARAGTIGKLNSGILADIDKRTAKFGGEIGNSNQPDFASFGTPVEAAMPENKGDSGVIQTPDFSSFGTLAEQPTQSAPQPKAAPDFSQYGTAV